ncbi:hypothetical protein PHET_06476 [Paragonimus heterotremus]|uniref:Uncharacterized protein n=1 Tax=Paragonimus heterotremus TaxID=100268 RepID=A0A8J4SYP9_9TREM|nr:hypothetical protein PHET_06476 [Paragonimus heterotremus]
MDELGEDYLSEGTRLYSLNLNNFLPANFKISAWKRYVGSRNLISTVLQRCTSRETFVIARENLLTEVVVTSSLSEQCL